MWTCHLFGHEVQLSCVAQGASWKVVLDPLTWGAGEPCRWLGLFRGVALRAGQEFAFRALGRRPGSVAEQDLRMGLAFACHLPGQVGTGDGPGRCR